MISGSQPACPGVAGVHNSSRGYENTLDVNSVHTIVPAILRTTKNRQMFQKLNCITRAGNQPDACHIQVSAPGTLYCMPLSLLYLPMNAPICGQQHSMVGHNNLSQNNKMHTQVNTLVLDVAPNKWSTFLIQNLTPNW